MFSCKPRFPPLAAWLVGFSLLRFFAVAFPVAASLTLLCAAEPLQLVSERYILTEAFGTFVFAVLLVAAFAYLRLSSFSLLALIQILGVSLVTLRVSALPLVVTLSILLPLLSRRAMSVWKSLRRSLRGTSARVTWARGLRFIALPLVFSIGFSQLMLFGYRLIYGALTGGPAAYTHADGLFLAADLAPVIKPLDFPVPATRDAVFRSIKYPLSDPDLRSAQRLFPGGLDDSITRAGRASEVEANRLARDTAWNALRRDPLAAVRLALSTYAEYFDYNKLKSFVLLEQRGVPPLPRDIDMMKVTFGLDVRQRNLNSWTKTWEQHAILWYWFLLIVPLVFPLALVANLRRATTAHLICAVCALAFLFDAIAPVEFPDPRYLTTLAWLAFLMIGSLFPRSAARTRASLEAHRFASADGLEIT